MNDIDAYLNIMHLSLGTPTNKRVPAHDMSAKATTNMSVPIHLNRVVYDTRHILRDEPTIRVLVYRVHPRYRRTEYTPMVRRSAPT
jgi:hypothetical protein